MWFTMKKNKAMKFFSDLGRSLLMPIAALAACGIVLGISSALLKGQVQEALPFLAAGIPNFILTTINKVSGIVFTLIPVMFSISISFGLAKEEKEIAAFAGFIGYYTFLVASSCMINSGFMNFDALKISTILGVETLDMGAIAGMITGIITAEIHNKYHKITFPVAVSFYGGKRFVAIAVILAMTVTGLIAPLVWAPVSMGIDALGGMISATGLAGVFCFGFLERLLIPTGLHHVLNGVFRTTSIGGVYHGVEGCLNIFLQFIDKVDLKELRPYTVFLGQGKMPMMMFGLPGAALAIYQTAPKEKKAKVKALMIAGVAACVVSGITEPLEFSFMFVAPVLFVFHAFMGGLSFVLMAALKVIIGNTGGGLIDYLIWGVFQPGSHWYWVLITGPFFFVIYYIVFKKYLIKKNLSIDVSDDDEDDGVEEETSEVTINNKQLKQAKEIIKGLGGSNNIKVVNNCLTRLRVDVVNMKKVDETLLKRTGAMGIVHSSDVHIQVIYGPKVESIAANVREVLKSDCTEDEKEDNSQTEPFCSPMSGTMIPMEQVPDPAFSEKMMGDGFAIEPKDGIVQAPFDGSVEMIFPTGHAIGVKSHDGMEVLIHLGIDTVDMKGEGFEVLVEQGDRVKQGDILIKVDLDAVKKAGKKSITPIIFTSGEKIELLRSGKVTRGEKRIIRIHK